MVKSKICIGVSGYIPIGCTSLARECMSVLERKGHENVVTGNEKVKDRGITVHLSFNLKL